jgi:hypothetical protein
VTALKKVCRKLGIHSWLQGKGKGARLDIRAAKAKAPASPEDLEPQAQAEARGRASAVLAGKAPAMGALWQQAQEAEVSRLQAELDDSRMRSGDALEITEQLSETLAAAHQLRACGPEALPPAVAAATQAPPCPDGLAPAVDFLSWYRAPVCTAPVASTAPVVPTDGACWDQLFGGRVAVASAADLAALVPHGAAAAVKAEADCTAPGTTAHGDDGDCLADAAMMTAAEKKKAIRAATKDLYTQLDALLPPICCAHTFDADALGGQGPSSRGAGRSGRSLNEILHEVVHRIKMHHRRHGSAPGQRPRKGLRGPGRRAKKPVGAAAHGSGVAAPMSLAGSSPSLASCLCGRVARSAPRGVNTCTKRRGACGRPRKPTVVPAPPTSTPKTQPPPRNTARPRSSSPESGKRRCCQARVSC